MPTAQPGGLFVGQKRVPLLGVSIHVAAHRTAAEVTVAQRYVNEEQVPVEAVYSFPLPESAAVCGFEALIGDKRIIGRVEEKEAAFERYDQAMSDGHGAYLLDQDRPNLFTASVGNVLAGQQVVIKLTYAMELEQTGDEIRVLVPTTISPRYMPPEQLASIDPAELDHLAPPTVLGRVPYGLQLQVDIDAAAEIRELACPSHPMQFRLAGQRAHAELMGEHTQLDQDFVLNVRLAEPHRPVAVVARDGDAAVLMLNLFPDLENLPRIPSEVVFVLDRSGSMQGESIAQARSALQLCLRSLREGDYFNIVGFGSSFATLFPDSRPYGQRSLEEATAHVALIDADMNGTEMLAPLRSVLEAPPIQGLPRHVVLLTDGQVGNESQCIDLAARHADHCRLFTFGIGRGVSEHLVRGLARAGRGEAELIHPNERIEPKVLRQFGRLSRGGMKNVRLDWGDVLPTEVIPRTLPSLFSGDRMTIYARTDRVPPGECAVLADDPAGNTVRFAVRVGDNPACESRAVLALMARRAIQELEENPGKLSGSQQENRHQSQIRRKIRELALRYQIMSSETSFVAIEEREQRPDAPAELRRIPVALTRGWGGTDGLLDQVLAAMPTAAPGYVGSGAPRSMMRKLRASVDSMLQAYIAPSASVDFDIDANPPAPAAPPADPLIELILLQQADGSFLLDKRLADVAGLPLEKLRKASRGLGPQDALAERVVATVAALWLLEARFPERRDEWSLLAEKARQWLHAQSIAVPQPHADWQAWARQVLA